VWYEEKPWLRFYEPHVPPHLDYRQTTLPDALRETARQYPDRPAMIFYTPRELAHQLNDSGAQVIVTLSLTYPRIRQIRERRGNCVSAGHR